MTRLPEDTLKTAGIALVCEAVFLLIAGLLNAQWRGIAVLAVGGVGLALAQLILRKRPNAGRILGIAAITLAVVGGYYSLRQLWVWLA